jgi:tetratricopeptide (TPR) repeat protein
MKRVLAVAMLAGCAATQEPAPTGEAKAPPVVAAPAPHKESVAIAGLMDSARTDLASGRLANAAASLERALRIEPRNPRLWHELARVRLKQQQYAQAESVAARSNSWAADDPALRAENWRLIAETRDARGDKEGAREALETAARVTR